MILIVSVSMITFLVIQAPPGDYASYVIMRFQNAPMTEEMRQIRIDEVRRRYNLDDPLHLQLISPPGRLVGGQIMFRRQNGDAVDLGALEPDSKLLKAIRGNDIAMIFQEPMLAFSPVYTIGNQISEVIRLHQGGSKRRAIDQTIALLEHVGVSAPAKRVNQYPHEYSGGMRQRAMIAMALSCNPDVLIADEPTTALDVTIEAKILALLGELQKEYRMSIIFITHDMAVVAEMADEVAVMYLGKVVERADVHTLFERPLHPYTVGLLNSIPGIVEDPSRHLSPIEGSVPNPYEVPVGCPFAPRCGFRESRCSSEPPEVAASDSQMVKCWLYA